MMKPHMISYRFDGGEWSITVHAHDAAEAMARVRAAATNGEAWPILLQIETRAPLPLMAPIMGLLAWAANAWRAISRAWRA